MKGTASSGADSVNVPKERLLEWIEKLRRIEERLSETLEKASYQTRRGMKGDAHNE